MANTRDITFGSVDVVVADPNIDDRIHYSCIDTFDVDFTPQTREIVCDVREGLADLRRFGGNGTLSWDTQEFKARQLAVAVGGGTTVKSGTEIVRGSDVAGDRIVGPDDGASPPAPGGVSDSDNPPEWRIVQTDGSGNFETYLANGNIEDLAFYLGDPDQDGAISEGSLNSGSISIDDDVLGKVVGDSVSTVSDSDGSDEGQSGDAVTFTYDASAGHDSIKIDGREVIVDSDVQQGDTVAIIGFAYVHDNVKDESGSEIPADQRQLIEIPAEGTGDPVRVYAVHWFDKDQDHKAMIIRAWKCLQTTGFSASFANDDTLVTPTTELRTIADKKNHPNAPHMEIEFIDSDSNIDDNPLNLLV